MIAKPLSAQRLLAEQESVEIFDNGARLGVAHLENDGRWSLTTTGLALGRHVFTAKAGTLASSPWTIDVIEQTINPLAPHVDGIAPPVGNAQQLEYYSIEADIHIVVPNYNMHPADTVKLYWVGRSTTIGSAVQTVANPPGPLRFTISKYEVIDVIGYDTTQVYYTIRRAPGSQTIESRHLALSVSGTWHDFTVIAPTLNGSHDNLRVQRQSEFSSQTTVRVRAIGTTEWESRVLTFNNEDHLNFSIDPAWAAQNKGKSVLFNYSVQVRPSDPHYLFSQLLRLNPF